MPIANLVVKVAYLFCIRKKYINVDMFVLTVFSCLDINLLFLSWHPENRAAIWEVSKSSKRQLIIIELSSGDLVCKTVGQQSYKLLSSLNLIPFRRKTCYCIERERQSWAYFALNKLDCKSFSALSLKEESYSVVLDLLQYVIWMNICIFIVLNSLFFNRKLLLLFSVFN